MSGNRHKEIRKAAKKEAGRQIVRFVQTLCGLPFRQRLKFAFKIIRGGK